MALSLLIIIQGGVLSAQSVRTKLIDSLAHPVTDSSGVFMVFAQRSIDLGTVAEDGGAVSCRFSWTNEGSKEITVTQIVTTCACAAPTFQKRAVAPGDSSSFEVRYYPKGHPGKIDRRIMVYTSLSGARPAAVLTLKGYVEPAVKPTWSYPVAFGPLLLKRREVIMDVTSGRTVTERILCLNAGEDELRLGVKKELVPPGFEVWVEPEAVQAGGEADVCIRFRPGDAPRVPGRVAIVLEGLSLPPSERTIYVNLKNDN